MNLCSSYLEDPPSPAPKFCSAAQTHKLAFFRSVFQCWWYHRHAYHLQLETVEWRLKICTYL